MSSVSQESSLLETEFPLVILLACPSALWSVKSYSVGGVCAQNTRLAECESPLMFYITQASSDDGACLKGSERSRRHSYLPVSPFLEPIALSQLHGCLGWGQGSEALG